MEARVHAWSHLLTRHALRTFHARDVLPAHFSTLFSPFNVRTNPASSVLRTVRARRCERKHTHISVPFPPAMACGLLLIFLTAAVEPLVLLSYGIESGSLQRPRRVWDGPIALLGAFLAVSRHHCALDLTVLRFLGSHHCLKHLRPFTQCVSSLQDPSSVSAVSHSPQRFSGRQEF